MHRYSDHDIEVYLATFAPLDSYYLSCLNGAGSESIYYVDAGGRASLLIEERDDVFLAAIAYLRARSTPVFDDVLQLKAHEESLKARPG